MIWFSVMCVLVCVICCVLILFVMVCWLGLILVFISICWYCCWEWWCRCLVVFVMWLMLLKCEVWVVVV